MKDFFHANRRKLEIVVFVLLGLYCLVVTYNIVFTDKQWDLKVFYYAAEVHSRGGDPYENGALSETADEEITLPFVYPPVALYLFKPFTWVGYQTAYYIFFLLKALSVAGLILLWRRHFIKDKAYFALLLIFCAWAFRETMIRGIHAGNVSIFEQLLLWGGIFFLLNRKPYTSALLIAASALFKIVGILFLLPLLLDRKRRSTIATLVASGLFVSVHTLSYLFNPELFRSFLGNAATLDDRGASNPALLAIVRDWSGYLQDLTNLQVGNIEWGVYFVCVAAIVVFSLLKLKGFEFRKEKLTSIFVFMFLYALLLPRFKNYSFVLLIVPSLYVIRVALKSTIAKVIAVVLICVTLSTYHPYYVALLLYGLLLRHISTETAGQVSATPAD